MRRIAIIFWLASTLCFGQKFYILLHGSVTDYYSAVPLKSALVHVEGGGVNLDMITKKDGSYEVRLEKGWRYAIVFSRAGYVSKSVVIDASGVPAFPDVPLYDMDLQMTLFRPLPDFDLSFFEDPIAEATYRHSVRTVNWDNPFSEEKARRVGILMREYNKVYRGYYARAMRCPPVVLFDSALVFQEDSSDEKVLDKALSGFAPEAPSYYDKSAAPATQVETVRGLFFTVQVGVYSRPRPLDELYGISPLNSELIEDGRIRYTSGRYEDAEAAQRRRWEVVNLGVRDAFIVAYFNGKRVPIGDAVYLKDKFGEKIR